MKYFYATIIVGLCLVGTFFLVSLMENDAPQRNLGNADTPDEIVELIENFVVATGTIGESLSENACELVANPDGDARLTSATLASEYFESGSPLSRLFASQGDVRPTELFKLSSYRVENIEVDEVSIFSQVGTGRYMYEVRVSFDSIEYIANDLIEFIEHHDEHEHGHDHDHHHGDHFHFHELGEFFPSEDGFTSIRNTVRIENLTIFVVNQGETYEIYDIPNIFRIVGNRISIWDGLTRPSFSTFAETSVDVMCD